MSTSPRKNLLAGLMLMSFASALMSAPLPESPVEGDAQALPGWPVQRTFKQLGRESDSLLVGIHNTEQIEFTLRRDRIARDASLQLQYTPSPSLIPVMSQIRVYLNDVLMQVLPIEKDQLGRNTEQTVALDPRLIADFNRVRLEFIGHYTDICEDPANNTLWVNISRDSRINLQEQALSLSNDLAYFPLPFFDPRSTDRLTVPFVFAANPSVGEQKAAAILASYFGARANWRGTRFPVLFDTLPSVQNSSPTLPSVVFATNDHRPAFMNDLQAFPLVEAPVVELIDHPQAPYSKVLLVMGRNDQDLATAASALALGAQLMRGPRVTVNGVEPLQPRKPYDAPAWLPTDGPVRFAQLMAYPQQLQVSGLQPPPVMLDFNLPPDLFIWRKQGIPLRLLYRYSAPSTNEQSQLNISLNNSFISSLPLLKPNRSSLQELSTVLTADSINHVATLILPLTTMADRNRLAFDFNFANVVGSAQRDRCQTMLPIKNEAIVDENSTLDLSGYYHYIGMPNLKAFARSGFPFSRMADLSETIAVVPSLASPVHISTLLQAIAGIAGRTGYPALGLRLSDDWQSVAHEDADLLLLGPLAPDMQDNPDISVLLQRQRDRLLQPFTPMTTATDTRRDRLADQRINAAHRVEVSADQPIAAIEGLQSPFHPQRSIVVLSGNNDADFRLLREALSDSAQLDAITGSAAVIRSSGVYSQRVGDTYYVGNLPWYWLLWYHLSGHPVLLALFAVISVLLATFLAWRAQRWAADRRQQQDE